MSNFKDNPPPDDWTKTTPNINLPGSPAQQPGSGGGEPDWAKTNYRIDIPANAQPAAKPDDFGKTVTNIKPIDTNQQDFGKTMYPGSASQPPPADWGATQANVPSRDFGSAPANDWGASPDKTTPYFQLPEAERAKYQQLPPTPTEQAAQAREEQDAKGGIPGWVWVVAGLMTMFFFAIVVLGAVYFFILRDSSFDVKVKGAPAGSDVLIDEKLIAVSDENGDANLNNLNPGIRNITINHPSFICDPIKVEGGRGQDPEPQYARCRAQTVKPTEDCAKIEIGEEDKAERCYNAALDALPTPFTPEQLVKALNILIINFNTGSSEISPRRIVALKKGADFIKKLPADIVLEVGGHTDNTGQAGPNMTLSEARSNAVKNTLVKFGVNGSILQTRGYGSTKPRPDVDGNTERGKFLNRRIEYMIVKR